MHIIGRNDLYCIIRWHISHTAYDVRTQLSHLNELVIPKHIAFLLQITKLIPYHFRKSLKRYKILQRLKVLAIELKNTDQFPTFISCRNKKKSTSPEKSQSYNVLNSISQTRQYFHINSFTRKVITIQN